MSAETTRSTTITKTPAQLDTPTRSGLPPGPPLPEWLQTVVFGSFRKQLMPLLRRHYGDMVRLQLLPGRTAVQLSDIEHIKQVFAGSPSTFHAGEGNYLLRGILGEHSVLITDDDVHLRARKLLMPAFNGVALRGYGAMMTDLAIAEVERWPAGVAFRSHARMQALTLEIILRVVIGVADGPRLDELRTRLRRLVDLGPIDILGWQQPSLQRYGIWRRNAQRRQRVDELLYAEIAERRRIADLSDRDDVLSRLLRVQSEDDGLSDAELRDQLITLLLAGHETTATALAWTFHELARDPVELAAAQRAADAGDEKHLEAVMKESLRLHPVIHELGRKLTRDIVLGGYLLPAGTVLMPSIGLVHADGALYAQPEAFRPSRFLDGGPVPGSWLPFGGGVRRCLGAGFSLMEGSIVLREVLRRHHLFADRHRPEPTRARNVTLVPGRGARISATPRHAGA